MTRSAGRSAAVLFDMDGVLVDSTEAHVAAWTAFLAERGIAVPEGGVNSLFGRRAPEALSMLLDQEVDSPAVRAALGDLEARATALLDEYAPGQQLVPGARQLVDRLVEAGWRVAVVTSARRHVAEHSLGPLLPAFEALVAAEDVDRGKPDPQAYLTAAAQLGVPAAACVVVEDAVAGVQAGARAGMHVVAVPTTAAAEQLREAGAAEVLERVTDLPQLLAREAGAVSAAVRADDRRRERGGSGDG